MSAELKDQETDDSTGNSALNAGHDAPGSVSSHGISRQPGNETDEEETDEDEEEDVEPNLKYIRLTTNLASVYRNGDSTSCFITSGDKMVCMPERKKMKYSKMVS